jgi:hypothetical protein
MPFLRLLYAGSPTGVFDHSTPHRGAVLPAGLEDGAMFPTSLGHAARLVDDVSALPKCGPRQVQNGQAIKYRWQCSISRLPCQMRARRVQRIGTPDP